jgi:hypothetical protein
MGRKLGNGMELLTLHGSFLLHSLNKEPNYKFQERRELTRTLGLLLEAYYFLYYWDITYFSPNIHIFIITLP